MKVLIVMNGPPTEPERVVHARRLPALAHALSTRGVDLTIALTGDRAGLARDLRERGVPVTILPVALPPSARGALRLPRAVVHVRRLVRRLAPDLVEGDEPLPAIATGLAARRRSIVTYRRHHHAGRPRLHRASRLAARLADATIVSTETMRRQAAEDDRTPMDRIEVSCSGTADLRRVSDDEIAALRASLGIEAADSVILVVSRLRHEKGIDVLLRAVSLLDGHPHVVVAGTGPEELALRTLARDLGVRAHFLGHRDDVAVLFALADLVAAPSRRETFGRTTIEAMAAGRALVATAVGGLNEAVIPGITGELVPPDDPASLAAALSKVLTDRDATRTMALAARKRYESSYTIEHMANAWAAAWDRASARARGERQTR